jgi:hypothetical protein
MKNQPLNQMLYQTLMQLPDPILNWAADELSDDLHNLYQLKKSPRPDKSNGLALAILDLKPIEGLKFVTEILAKHLALSNPNHLQPRQQPQSIPYDGTRLHTIDAGPHIGENLVGKY